MSSDNAVASFAQLNLPEPLQKALIDVGYETPSAIQAQIIPHMLEGVDVLGQAQTGTGKTAAFALPILQACHEHLREAADSTGSAAPASAAGATRSR